MASNRQALAYLNSGNISPAVWMPQDSAVSQLPVLGHFWRCLTCSTTDLRILTMIWSVKASESRQAKSADGQVWCSLIPVLSVSHAWWYGLFPDCQMSTGQSSIHAFICSASSRAYLGSPVCQYAFRKSAKWKCLLRMAFHSTVLVSPVSMGLHDQSILGPKSWITFLNEVKPHLWLRISSASCVFGAWD